MISVFFKIFFMQKIYILDYIQLIILVFVYRLVAQPGQRARLITVRSWVRIPASLLLILLIFSIFYTQCQFYRLFWIFFRYFLDISWIFFRYFSDISWNFQNFLSYFFILHQCKILEIWFFNVHFYVLLYIYILKSTIYYQRKILVIPCGKV